MKCSLTQKEKKMTTTSSPKLIEQLIKEHYDQVQEHARCRAENAKSAALREENRKLNDRMFAMEQYQRSATDANRVAGELRRVTEENKKLRLDLQERVAEILRLKESYQKVFESNVRATRRIGELEYNASRSVLRKAAREATSQLEAARKEIEILRGDKMQPGPPLQVNSTSPQYYGVDRILNYR
jgi:hypothetical protein